MIDRTELETRLAALHEQREGYRQRMRAADAALREAAQACAQLDGAISVVQDILAGDAPATTANGVAAHDPAAPGA
jgi:hypothetical protein